MRKSMKNVKIKRVKPGKRGYKRNQLYKINKTQEAVANSPLRRDTSVPALRKSKDSPFYLGNPPLKQYSRPDWQTPYEREYETSPPPNAPGKSHRFNCHCCGHTQAENGKTEHASHGSVADYKKHL